MDSKQIIIVGGGAAGFFAAINTATVHPEYSVTILEKTSKLLAKVRVSGGGRCNVTNACTDNSLIVKNYPRGEKELRSVFSRFSTKDTIDWFEKRGVVLASEEDGRMFPVTNNSETIVDCLIREAEKNRVKIKLNAAVEEIIKKADGTFRLNMSGGGVLHCDKLLIASGGNSNEAAYNWLKMLGHTILKPVPSLFTFNVPDSAVTKLMGLSMPHVKVKLTDKKIESEGAILITHWGFSGPAILKASAWGARTLNELDYTFPVFINWLPKYTEEKLRIELETMRSEFSSKFIISSALLEIPKRLWEYFIQKAGISSIMRWSDLPKKSATMLIRILLNDEYKVKGKTTFKEEFVTCGGVSLKEIDLATMQSKIVPNLYFAGEVIDVDGITGGFNFQNAWSTGFIASRFS